MNLHIISKTAIFTLKAILERTDYLAQIGINYRDNNVL